ncbi:DNA cytosine methyltransferase [Streptomyces liangshanensis]|uniref:DNA (cytosine-5-)-methyltransferase n=1 Tax=Streptomyces liangshanensis TaxID=2717324 RepID=A0A6G9H2V8_9ACTN|nr:DNA cytosine methyltransferase [Streptomyces liangshanensis]QIQ04656.1 DNA cytosine methyltransferase [Streptomyces liangshanensis]
MRRLRSVDVCSGAGGLALGLEQAGFDPVLVLDHKPVACRTLRTNRPSWQVLETDLLDFDPVEHQETYDVDLLSAGLPRVRSAATRGRPGSTTEQRLLEATILLVHAVQPRALLVENVPDLVDGPEFAEVRDFARKELIHLGYEFHWFVVNAADFGVPQDRKQGVLVAVKDGGVETFRPPRPTVDGPVTVGEALHTSMSARGWTGADAWSALADSVAPTLVGGSDNRGGADLGPTGTKKAWARMGINGGALSDEVPDPDGVQESDTSDSTLKKITVEQAAVLQGFPDDWRFAGGKTARYRQIGHASPPPVGRALGTAVARALGL